MKKLSFKVITTIWITLLIAIVCGISITALILITQITTDEKLKQLLVDTVQNNSNELEFSNGIFEIENDFAYYSDEIYCDLFSEDGVYISGETPSFLIEVPSELKKVVKRTFDGNDYYVYSEILTFTKFEYEIDIYSGQIISYEVDVTPLNEPKILPYSNTHFRNGISTNDAIEIALSHAGIKHSEATIISAEIPVYGDRQVFKIEFTANSPSSRKIYIRAICLVEDVEAVITTVGKSAIYIFPFFVVIAAVGAYILSKKTVAPIENIISSAHRISTGNDLSKRLETQNASREISDLADTFNEMFERLHASFENEKRFTSDASHELRTPLAVIKAECEYVLSQNTDEEEKMQAFESIKEQTDKMTSLVSALLSVTRAEQGLSKYTLEKANLGELLEVICNNFKTAKNIILKKEIDHSIVIHMNTTLMIQLVENLLSNAVKYGKENGIIDVKLYSEHENAVLSVRDNGIGISKADLPNIWNRFYRADTSRSKTEGFGLGLALVKKIAEIHSAGYTVESEIDKYTEIRIIFKKI